jgi:Zn finger protein HypA/HybF involved in hydrogenase expression
MEGPPYVYMDSENMQIDETSGILPRTAEFIFDELKRIRASGNKEFRVEISSLEIYCDNVRDLYSEEESTSQSLNLITVKNKVVIQGQTWKRVETPIQFLKHL